MKKLAYLSITTNEHVMVINKNGISVTPYAGSVSDDTVQVIGQYENGDTRAFYVLNDQLLDCLRAGINAVKFKTPFFLEGEKI